MIVFDSQLFEQLKSEALVCAGILQISPKSCKELSLLIFSKTDSKLSETTLKRVYGLTSSAFIPSSFTVEAFSKYCDYDSWADFYNKKVYGQDVIHDWSVEWDILRRQAEDATRLTIQAIKNRSGIPFAQTIKRKSIDSYMNDFAVSGYHATVIASPAGYGKTIGLAHWVDEKLKRREENDIVLFFSSNALLNIVLFGSDLNEWLLALTGCSDKANIAALHRVDVLKPGNFYLVIDGFDEHMFKNGHFGLLMNLLKDISAFYQSCEWFKLVIAMRSENWINQRHNFDFSLENWYIGNLTNEPLSTNVPLLNVREVKELSLKINPGVATAPLNDIATHFNHPIYFQFYYRQHRDSFSLNEVDHVYIYDLVSNFILSKVHLGEHGAEKILFIKGLAERMDIKNKVYDFDILKTTDFIKLHHHAYQEFLEIGFLTELNLSDDDKFSTRLRFINVYFMEYVMAQKLLFDNGRVFDKQLIDAYNVLFKNNEHKIPVIKWCILGAIKDGEQQLYDLLPTILLNPNEKADLIVFLSDLLEKNPDQFSSDCNDSLFNYLLGVEFIDRRYKKTLQKLLKFDLSLHKRILVYTGLAAIAVLELNLIDLNIQIVRLQRFHKSDFRKFPISPLSCLRAMYQYFKYNRIDRDFLTEATRFYFNPEIKKDHRCNEPAFQMSNLLTAYSLMIGRESGKSVKFLNALYTLRKGKAIDSYTYFYFTQLLTSDFYFAAKRQDKFIALYEKIIFVLREDELTPFMKEMLASLKLKHALIRRDYAAIANLYRDMLALCEISGNKITASFASALLLNSPGLMNIYPKLRAEVKQNYATGLKKCGISFNLFQLPDLI